MLAQGIDLDAPPYRPDLVQLFMIPGSATGPPDSSKTFVHHVEMGFMWDSQVNAIATWLPGVGSIMAGVAIASAALIPTVPPATTNPNLDGDGQPPLYFLRPIPPAIPNPGISLAPIIGAAIDAAIGTTVTPAGLAVKPPALPAVAALIFTQWIAQTTLLTPGRIFSTMTAYDAAWIQYLTLAAFGL